MTAGSVTPNPYATSVDESFYEEDDHNKDGDSEVNIKSFKAEPDEDLEIDLYEPMPDHPDLPAEENGILTFRAVLVGWVLGVVVNASNVYLGLKAGITFDATFFGSLIGFAIIKPLSRTAIPMLGGSFGPKEHSIIQTVATATGGLSALFISAVPAMFQLGVLGPDPSKEYGKMVSLTASSALLGTMIAVPLRRFFIIKLGREMKMVFPTAVAVATIIRSLHLGASGTRTKKMIRLLLATVGVSIVWVVGASYCKGILYDWYPFWWIYAWGNYNNWAVHAVSWSLLTIEWSPAMIGTGFMIPLNASISWILGFYLAFGVIGPVLVGRGLAVGTPFSTEYPDLVTYMGLESEDYINAPSPRYWVLWPALLGLICVSIAEISTSWKSLAIAVKMSVSSATGALGKLMNRKGQQNKSLDSKYQQLSLHPIGSEDTTAKEDEERWWEVTPLFCAGMVLAVVILSVQYHLHPGLAIFNLVLSFIFAVVAVLITGQVGISTVAMAAQTSQLAIGGIQRGMNLPQDEAMLGNLGACAVSGTAAQQAAELLTDYKIGFFLRASPRAQMYGQLLGCLLAVFLSPLMFIIFMKAYPCVLDLSQAATCTFTGPAIQSYRAVTVAILSPQFPIPRESWIFAIIFSIFGVLITLARGWAYGTNRKTLGDCLPNMLMVCLSMVIPSVQYGIAFTIGGIAASLWKRKRGHSFQSYGICLAAGLIAGEGMGGLINAILAVARIGGPTYYGTTVGCPPGSC